MSLPTHTHRSLLEEALQLERQLHVALLADKLNQEEEDRQQQHKDAQGSAEGQEKDEEESHKQQQEADADAAAASSLAIPGVRQWHDSIHGAAPAAALARSLGLACVCAASAQPSQPQRLVMTAAVVTAPGRKQLTKQQPVFGQPLMRSLLLTSCAHAVLLCVHHAGGSAIPDPEDVPEEDLELSLEQLEK